MRTKLVRRLLQRGEFSLTLPFYHPEFWHIFHDELGLNGSGHLDPKELHSASSKAGTVSIFHTFQTLTWTIGIELSPSTATEFIRSLSAKPHPSQISFGDFFILLSRKVSPAEIYQSYEVKKYMANGYGSARADVKGIQFIWII
jgi:solute carrier family 25 phosphate transporter 23/24/25/41